uniref:Pyranose 2-oxidase n=1 Tax=Phanerodontia chrysosporium TaxID=2822231 RepID=UPI0003D101FB|nr:Chain A, Pyranose 2-oxidase [Phanerodontia chrysosporium]4MIH_B Chain B, Pyranose 2-oxidase [Phanerodontia chrysosporium]4MIH_C Chain C, Pyranose 2-oxidase [Phanerodontia chrysosporium]4MIH_D Chain D, Pyranose 2-oxidase [Phanerodontia chrysosporium]4MIH_E Chain E, Pyranose 2-oxidase [Phanerodontia chrysosporium]4MIH_F Chain F, Pyranose 2-oxidase [Phanerodontia chrysosporium]4MIH_G Chain G, Pyranose 2-oxidase [Phanerodontia chrysosporium]4MIH_H Chain H, Pyranose 2-oxidase [Phanerodontia ch
SMFLDTTPFRADEPYDVFIAGSGPIGATFAKLCVDANLRVCMVEIGAADSFTSKPMKGDPNAPRSVQFGPGQVPIPGYHKKNEIEYQKDIDRFVNVIKGALSTCSIPTSNNHIATLDPSVVSNSLDKPFISLGKNPAQNPFVNLGAEAVTRGVGGMSTAWTCATPEFFAPADFNAPHRERPKLSTDAAEDARIWKDLYAQAKEIIGTSTTEFDHSIRHNLVLRKYNDIFQKENVIREFSPLPLACHRLTDPDYVEWHATDRILEELFTDPVKRGRFTLLTNHRCTKLVFKHYRPGEENEVDYALVEDLLPHMQNPGNPASVKKIYARSYVVACGAVATAQVLANSHIPPDDVVIPFPGGEKGSGGGERDATIPTPLMPMLGKYITEQPMTFCQVVLDSSLMEVVRNPPWPGLDWWKEKVARHVEAFPNDPIPIPFRDPEPQVTIKFTEEHPWHVQIHRDAFSYGAVAENMDTRVIVDYRFFGYTEPQEANELVFQQHYRDAYDMPQPTFKFTMSQDDRARARRMMDDMCNIALKIGGYLPGSEPQFMTPGLALHLAGTTRCGLDTQKTVGNTHCKVHNFNNLYVGGNGVIETGFAANPTLTSICYAIRASNDIIAKFGRHR